MIVIINYGMGNLGSILNMLKKIGAEALISSRSEEIEKADKLILPGVGAFDNGMKNLEELALLPVLEKKVNDAKTPILGICLGMQLMTRKSEEGRRPGLGWVDAETVKLRGGCDREDVRVPHMGWNSVKVVRESALFRDLKEDARFYFVHSYHVVCRNSEDVLALTAYGGEFISSFQKENIFGVQFHPEKSHRFGMTLLRNFVEA